MTLPLIPQPPMRVIVPGDPVEDVPCDHDRTVTNQRLCSPGETRCVDCGRAVDTADAATVADLADVPIWRYEAAEDECQHGATFTGYASLMNGDLVASEPFLATLCLVCHHLAPTPQEDPQP